MKWSAIVRSKPECSACVTFCSIVFAPDSSMISIRCAGTSPVEIFSRSSRCFILVTPSADTSSCALSIIHS